MKNWDDTLKEKLSTYTYEEGPSQEKVDSFFDQMYAEKGASKPVVYRWLQLAAMVLLFCGVIAVSFQMSQIVVNTGKGIVEEVTLPDGSIVTLNAKSELSYNRVLWIFNRDINLDGEAFFDVKKGSAFKVISKYGGTEVLGTSFNIYARDNMYNVKCYTGKVKVSSGEEERIITPNQGVNFEYDKSVDRFQFDAKRNDWRDGEFYFNNQELEYVFQEFTLHYDVKVNLLGEIKNMKYSGYFPVENMDLALKLICDPMGLDYQISNKNTIDIKSISN